MIELGTDKIIAQAEGGVGWLTFNNPKLRNAISLEMWQGMSDALEAFETDERVRVVVMAGAGGRAFASGADISEFDKECANADQRKSYSAISQRARDRLANFRKPVVAMIQGACIGGGLAIALLADVRFATPGSKFGIPAAKLGLGYQYALVVALARVIGASRTRDILFSARIINADEAMHLGLVNFVVSDEELRDEVRQYAETIAGNAPLSILAAKAALAHFEKYPGGEESEALAALVDQCFNSEDYREGRLAFAEKRVPRFAGR